MGDHAAVYGFPAVVAAIGLHTTATVAEAEDSGVVADLVNFGERRLWTAGEIEETTVAAQGHWLTYSEDPTPERLKELVGEGGARRLIKLAIGEAARRLNRNPSHLTLRIESELPMSAGMGSSASVATAIVGALYGFWSQATDGVDVDVVAEVVGEVERRQHGFPSGIDHHTVLHGGVVCCERNRQRLSARPVDVNESVLPVVVSTGASEQSTGEVVEDIRRRTGGAEYVGWQRMAGLTEAFLEALGSGADPRPPVRSYQRELEKIGVVPAAVADWVRSWEDRGGVAKVSGAGAIRGAGAGCLLVYSDSDLGVTVPGPDLPSGWQRWNAPLGGPGLQVTVS